MKYKVKLRYQLSGQPAEKVSFHLEEGARFILGRKTPGFHLDRPEISEKQCTLSIEAGQMYVSDEGSGVETKLNHQKVRSRALHVGDILEFGPCTIEFIEVPFVQKSEEVAQTMFLDLSEKSAAPLAQAADRPARINAAEVMPEAAREAPLPASDPVDEVPAEWAHLTRSQRKKKMRARKRAEAAASDAAYAPEPPATHSDAGSNEKHFMPGHGPTGGTESNEASGSLDGDTIVSKTLENPESAAAYTESRASQESHGSRDFADATAPALPSRKRVTRVEASERARRDAEELRRRLDTVPPADGITDQIALPRLKAQLKQRFVRSTWLQVALGASVPAAVLLIYLLFSSISPNSPSPNTSTSPTTAAATSAPARAAASVSEAEPEPSADAADHGNGTGEVSASTPAATAPVATAPVVTMPAPLNGSANGSPNAAANAPISADAKRVIEREVSVRAPRIKGPGVAVATAPAGKDHSSELVEAAGLGDLRTVQNLMFEEGVSPDSKTVFGETPLLAASSKGQIVIVRLLIDKGVNINGSDPDGNTPLMRAVTGGHTKVVQFLVLNGASTRLRNRKGDTAIRLATRWGRQEIVRFLQGSGSDPANRKRTPASRRK